MYWRKHWDMHDWFYELHLRRGGSDGRVFDEGGEIELTLADIASLHSDLKDRKDPKWSTHFDWTYDEDFREADFHFIYKAKRKLKQGKRLFYRA